jgi:very-short-patch-repair endonuclease
MTDAERRLWSRLKMKQLSGCQFYRQKIIGDYIADFYCHKTMLVIEIDGGEHFTERKALNDKIRDRYFESLGLTVLRFSNLEVLKNTDSVLEQIFLYSNPPESPFTKGGK